MLLITRIFINFTDFAAFKALKALNNKIEAQNKEAKIKED